MAVSYALPVHDRRGVLVGNTQSHGLRKRLGFSFGLGTGDFVHFVRRWWRRLQLQSQGRPRTDLLPHQPQWKALGALCIDGAIFTVGKLKNLTGGGGGASALKASLSGEGAKVAGQQQQDASNDDVAK